jgi:NACHT domain/Sulfatase-modifying factor enzyme 1
MPEEPQKSQEVDSLEKIRQKLEELALSWGLPGAAIALALHFAREQQWTPAISLMAVAGLIALLVRFFDKLLPYLDKLLEWLAGNFAGWLQRLWWKLTAQFQGRYYESLVFACRDFRTQGLKTKGPFTLDLEKVFVSLRVAPESPDRVMAGMMQSRGTSEGLKIWDFLAEQKKQPTFRRIVVIAPPGAGKSTLLEHLALTYAKNNQRRRDRRAPKLIPVLLYLRDVREIITGEQPPDLAMLIEQQETIKRLNPQGWFQRNLDQGKCLVMLDGLDEVADENQRQQVSQWVDLQMQRYPKTPFILTSRPFGYRSAPLTQVGTVLEIKPFNLAEMKQFVNSWYLQQELMSRRGKDDRGVRDLVTKQADDLTGRIQGVSTLAAMAINPLLLTMIATVHCFRGALPGRRVELYHEICDVLLGRRQEAKKIPDTLTATQKKVVLQVLALGLMKQQTREFTPELGAHIIQDKLQDIGGYEANATQFLKQVENTSGLLVEREQGVYEFAHKSFQEYLAAVELSSSNQFEILTGKMQDAWWDETIRLYAAQADSTYLVEAALQNANVTALTLAYDCVEEGLSIRPEVRQSLEDKLNKGLESVDANLFKLAAEVKLARRLKRLIRIDEKTEIDDSLITCAEYQLFIDEKLRLNIHQYPDHWTGRRFLPGDAAKPITGIRASDAEEFCRWLTDHSAKKYRLLTWAETENHPISLQAIGYWCNLQNSNKKKIVGISQQYWKNWSQLFLDARTYDLSTTSIIRGFISPIDLIHELDLVRELDLDLEFIHDLDRDHNLEFMHNLDLDRNLERDRNIDDDIIRARNLARNLAGDFEYARNPDIDIAQNLDRDLDLARNPNLVRDLARNFESDYAVELAIAQITGRARTLPVDLARILTSKRDHSLQSIEIAQIRFSLLILTLLWNLLSRTYVEAKQKQKKTRAKKYKIYEYENLSQKYDQQRDNVYRIYKFYVLVKERQVGKIPVWEGIRIASDHLIN